MDRTPAPPARAADLRECPGCGELVERMQIACALCWRSIPGHFKARFAGAPSGSGARARVVAEMREWLRERPGLTTP